MTKQVKKKTNRERIADERVSELLHTKRWVYWISADQYIEGAGFRVSIVFEGVAGHYPTGNWPYEGKPGQTVPYFWGNTLEEAEAACDDANKARGISAEEAFKIVSTSISAQNRGTRGR